MVGGNIVVMSGLRQSGADRLIEEWGGIGLIAVNPGVDIHWGICTTIWGTPDLDDLPRKPKIPVVAVNNPDGQELIALAEQGGEATDRHRAAGRLVPQKIPVVDDPGRARSRTSSCCCTAITTAGTSASATTPPAMRRCWRSRACCGRTARKLRRSVRIAWWPGHSTGRYAGSTWFADSFAIDLDRELRGADQLRQPRLPLGDQLSRDHAHVARPRRIVDGRDPRRRAGAEIARRCARTRPATTASTISACRASSCCARPCRRSCGRRRATTTSPAAAANIAWHTENDTLEIADRDILLTDMKIYLLSTLRIANAEVLPVRLGARRATSSWRRSTPIRRRRKGLADLSAGAAATEALKAALAKLGEPPRRGSANKAVLRNSARILVPINYTREPRFRHDPAYTVPPLPTLAVAAELPSYTDDHLRRVAQVELMRGANRFLSAMDQALQVVEAACR